MTNIHQEALEIVREEFDPGEFDEEWRVCPTCNGEGSTSSHLGSWTSEEWHREDPQFREDYMSGRFDKPCGTCKGRTTIRTIAEATSSRAALSAFESYINEMYEMEAIRQAEMRAGA